MRANRENLNRHIDPFIHSGRVHRVGLGGLSALRDLTETPYFKGLMETMALCPEVCTGLTARNRGQYEETQK
jgi:hypothetical protein